MRLRGMYAHSHPHPVCGNERPLGGDCRRHGIGRTLEADEEGVPLGIDLVPPMGRKRFAQDTTMLRTQITVRRTMPARKLRRALDVAKQERHRPARQTSIHPARCYAEWPSLQRRRGYTALACPSVREFLLRRAPCSFVFVADLPRGRRRGAGNRGSMAHEQKPAAGLIASYGTALTGVRLRGTCRPAVLTSSNERGFGRSDTRSSSEPGALRRRPRRVGPDGYGFRTILIAPSSFS